MFNPHVSGPIEAFVLAREDGIRTWRGMMGPTRALDAQYTQPTSLRGLHGLSNTRNATHGSGKPRCFIHNFSKQAVLRLLINYII